MAASLLNGRTWAAAAACAATMAALLLDPQAADGNARAREEGRLWRISRPGVEDSFVLGTIHIPDPRVSKVAEPVERALSRSRTLAMEIAAGPVAESRVFELEQLQNGERLESLIGAEAFGRLRAALVARKVPEEVIARLKPWAAMMKISLTAPSGESEYLDKQLVSRANARRMRIMPLEWIEEQAAAFDVIPLVSQVALLKHVLAHRETLATTIEPTIEAWLRGDLGALAAITERIGEQFPDMADHYAQLTRHIVHNRTAVLHHRLFVPLRGGRVFVAIGAMHLPGHAGLLAMLKRDGYRVTAMW
jgi:hypothetical protein